MLLNKLTLPDYVHTVAINILVTWRGVKDISWHWRMDFNSVRRWLKSHQQVANNLLCLSVTFDISSLMLNQLYGFHWHQSSKRTSQEQQFTSSGSKVTPVSCDWSILIHFQGSLAAKAIITIDGSEKCNFRWVSKFRDRKLLNASAIAQLGIWIWRWPPPIF